MGIRRLVALSAGVLFLATAAHAAPAQSDQQIRQSMIQESKQTYDGQCPCPYSVTKSGGQCGGNSAYSKPGGSKPLCYAADIPDAGVMLMRRLRNIASPDWAAHHR